MKDLPCYRHYDGLDGFYRVVYADATVGEGWATKQGALGEAVGSPQNKPVAAVRVRESEGPLPVSLIRKLAVERRAA